MSTLVCASKHCKDVEVFAKTLANDELAIAVFNRADYFTQYSKKYSIENVQVNVNKVIEFFMKKQIFNNDKFVPHQQYRVLDLWAGGKEIGVVSLKDAGTFESVVAQHDTQMYRLVPIN